MNTLNHFPTLALTAAASLCTLAAPRQALPETRATAAPLPPAIIEAEPRSASNEPRLHAAATLYSIGDPTAEEQLYVEMINRARANPGAEAQLFAAATDPKILQNYLFFGVDLSLMQAQFAAIPPVPPLALNAQLTAAARRHSADMLAKSFQDHVGSDNSTFGQRITDTGYPFATVGENIYANADSVLHGHAAFEVDWGTGPGGMQPTLPHRVAIHSPDFREIGVGVILGQNQPAPGAVEPKYRPVGPQLVTQEFGTRQGATPLITGVVYFDLNGNNFYDVGEGVGGVRVEVSGTATFGMTARSGGYAVPVAGNGTYALAFSAPGLPSTLKEVTVAQAQNQKVDFNPTYSPPSISGSVSPVVNLPNTYAISGVVAATNYQWRTFQLAAASVEGAENGLSTVTVTQSGAYNVFEAGAKKSGAYSFHLAHPPNGIREQSFVLHDRFFVTADSSLRFESRLGWATANQHAIAQVSTDEGISWEEVWRQTGNETPGETSFQQRSVSLAEYSGKIIKLRFAYLPTGLSYTDTTPGVGWLIDDITVQNGFEIANELVNLAPNGAFTFAPAVAADYVLQARARTGHEYLPWGPMLNVHAVEVSATPPQVNISRIVYTNGQAQIEVDLLSGSVPTSWTLQSTRALGTSWAAASITPEAISPTRFRFSVFVRGADPQQFYRVLAN